MKRFAHTSNWFVIFVQTYEERWVVERLQDKLGPERYIVSVPTDGLSEVHCPLQTRQGDYDGNLRHPHYRSYIWWTIGLINKWNSRRYRRQGCEGQQVQRDRDVGTRQSDVRQTDSFRGGTGYHSRAGYGEPTVFPHSGDSAGILAKRDLIRVKSSCLPFY